MDQRLSIITLSVRDLKTSRAFYDSLGWKVAMEEMTDNIVFYNMNGFVLGLYPEKNFDEEIQQTEVAKGSRFTLAYNLGSQEEVDQILNDVEKLGGTIKQKAVKRDWGGYSGYFADPDGHHWEVAYNPYTLPKSDGSYNI